MVFDFQSNYGKLMHDDMPHQYRNRNNTAIFLDAIGRQMDELKEFLFSVMIHRTLSTTRGIQLDYIGSIVALTRAEAKKLFNRNGDLSDAFYRRALYYKIEFNFSNATIPDILKYMRLYFSKMGDESDFIPESNKDIMGFHLHEEQEHPAAVIIESGDGTSNADPLPTFDEIRVMAEAKIPRGGGIGIRYRFWTSDDYKNYFKILTKNKIDIECAVEPFGSWNDDKLNPLYTYNDGSKKTTTDRHIWLSTEDGEILADENGDLFVYDHFHKTEDLYGTEKGHVLTGDTDEETDVMLGEDRVLHTDYMKVSELNKMKVNVANAGTIVSDDGDLFVNPKEWYSTMYVDV